MNLIDEIKKLNFQSDDFIIVGSGPMVIRGLKELNDIDIIVSRELFDECKKDDRWKQIPWTYPDHLGQIYLEPEPFLIIFCSIAKDLTALERLKDPSLVSSSLIG